MITISPGHWVTGGASDILNEVREARLVTNRVVTILRSWKIIVNHVEDNASQNKQDNLIYLVSQHNKTSRELDVSIHFNASGNTTNKGIGTEVLHYDAKELSAKMSKAISNASGLIDRGPKWRSELAFLANTHKTAILIEVCFVNSSVDVALYNRDFESICQAIANVLASEIKAMSTPSTNISYEVLEDEGTKVWRVQSGKFTTKQAAINAFEKSGLRYATIKGTKT